MFVYSLHSENVCRFRKMMTIEQFRSPEIAELYTKRYIDRLTDYHAGLFKVLIAEGQIINEDLNVLALMYTAPIITLLGVCDRQPEREAECLERLDRHVRLFFRTFNTTDETKEGGG